MSAPTSTGPQLAAPATAPPASGPSTTAQPAAAQDVHVPIDPAEDDADSAVGTDVESETTSLASSITHYRYENGRRYHAYRDGEYWGPNDETQNDQLDIVHHTYLILFDGKLFFAPITPKPEKILDIGTGTGIWALDFADQYPNTQVIGTDLSPIQPSWVPPNCKFEIDDAASEWTYAPNSFDFIHVRGLYGSIRDWPGFYQKVLKHLKPGAWYEQVEYSVYWRADDGTIPDNHVFKQWSDTFVESGERLGKTFLILDQQKGFMDEAGFDNVVEQRFKMPVGPWSSDPKLKEVGRWHLLECFQGIEGWSMALLTRIMGWSIDEVHVFLAKVRAGLRDRKVHAYTSVSVVYGQKPLGKGKQ